MKARTANTFVSETTNPAFFLLLTLAGCDNIIIRDTIVWEGRWGMLIDIPLPKLARPVCWWCKAAADKVDDFGWCDTCAQQNEARDEDRKCEGCGYLFEDYEESEDPTGEVLLCADCMCEDTYCAECYGEGEVEVLVGRSDYGTYIEEIHPCNHCYGSGTKNGGEHLSQLQVKVHVNQIKHAGL